MSKPTSDALAAAERRGELRARRQARRGARYAVACIRSDMATSELTAGRVSPEERGVRLALNEIEAIWREQDRKRRAKP